MQPLKLAPACLGSRTRDGSHGTREKKPYHNRRVSSRNRGKVSKVRDLFLLPFGNTGNTEPAFSDILLIS